MVGSAMLSIRGRSLLPLAAGLTTAQFIATLFVWRSNHRLFQITEALEAAGWMALPTGPAAAGLKSFAAAFWGGLFFTLSIGVGLALATWSALFFWNRLSNLRRSAYPLVAKLGPLLSIGWSTLILLVWATALVKINAQGFALFPTLFVVCVPLATTAAAIQRRPPEIRHRWWAPLSVLVLLTTMFGTTLHPMDERLFLAIRDRLLLSNPVGMAVNDFYYRYTLYAAQAFKSFGQKEARACRIIGPTEGRSEQRWITMLAGYDVLAVADGAPVDVTVTVNSNRLVLISPRGEQLEMTPSAFLRDPGGGLRKFSDISDPYAFFRRMTFFGLLLGFPILLFVLVDGIVGRMAGILIREPASTWVRSSICLVIGIILLMPIWVGRPAEVHQSRINEALTADTWQRRVAALRLIAQAKIEITDYPGYEQVLKSHRLVERYYAARALAVSHDPKSYDDLLALTRDPQPNVVCQAYYALGERRDSRAIAVIRQQIEASDHWYAQWYGYRAMKRLGWRQTLSK